jgi:hypothetical protein
MDMKSISQKLQDDIRKVMEGSVAEALIGKQRNIDTNNNGKIDAEDFVKLRAMKKTPSGKVHNCATHVEHAVYGKGVTVSEQHAEPDTEGNIEWYTVQFESSTQKVLTKDLTITMSESHEHKAKKDKMSEAMSHQATTTMKHIPNASPALKKAAKDIKPGIAGYRDRVAMLKAGGVKEEASKESKKDFQDRQQRLAAAGAETAKDPARMKRMSSIPGYSAAMDLAKKSVKEEAQLNEKDEGKPGLMFKKIAAKAAARYGSVEAGNRVAGAIRKKVLAKEGVEVTEEEIDAMFEGLKDSYTFTEYLEEARAQFGDDEAVSIANTAFNKQDITLFIK